MQNGTRYSGEFEQNQPNGYGVQISADGVTYSGLWENGVRNGTGTLDFGDGTSFVGEFKNGLAYDGLYDFGDGRITDSYQNDDGDWVDR